MMEIDASAPPSSSSSSLQSSTNDSNINNEDTAMPHADPQPTTIRPKRVLQADTIADDGIGAIIQRVDEAKSSDDDQSSDAKRIPLYVYSLIFVNDNGPQIERSTSGDLFLNGFLVLSLKELFVPEFAVARRNDIYVTGKLELRYVVNATETNLEELRLVHNYFSVKIGNQAQLSMHARPSINPEENVGKEHRFIFVLPCISKEEAGENAPTTAAATTTTTTTKTVNSVLFGSVPSYPNATPLRLDLLKEYLSPIQGLREYFDGDQFKQKYGMSFAEIRATLSKYTTYVNIKEIQDTNSDPEFIKAVNIAEEISKQFEDKVVITNYNSMPYIIEHVDFLKHPLILMDNQVTFLEFYRDKWKIDIQDTDQPLLKVLFADVKHARRKKKWQRLGMSAFRYCLQEHFNRLRPTTTTTDGDVVSSSESAAAAAAAGTSSTEQQDATTATSSNNMSDDEGDEDEDMLDNDQKDRNNTSKATEEISRRKIKRHWGLYLVPQTCSLSHLSSSISTYSRFMFKSLCHIRDVTQYYDKLAHFEKRINIQFRNKELLRQAFTHTTYAVEKQLRSTDNQRLEFLGDAVLDVTVSEFLYRNFPQAQEGEMTNLRTQVVRNNYLQTIGTSTLNLMSYLLYPQFQKCIIRDARSVAADTFEAIIGAVFLDRNLPEAQEFIHKNILEVVTKEYRRHPKFGAPVLITAPTPPMNERTLGMLAELEEAIGVSFDNKMLLLEALTHSSWKNRFEGNWPAGAVFDYERLEFLGDSILKFIAGHYLFLHYPEATEGEMTLSRHASVDNTISLPLAASKIQLHKYVIHALPPGSMQEGTPSFKSVVSDVFEALIGAIFLDKKGLYKYTATKPPNDTSGAPANNNDESESGYIKDHEYDVYGGIVHRFILANRTEVNPYDVQTPFKNLLQELIHSAFPPNTLPVYKPIVMPDQHVGAAIGTTTTTIKVGAYVMDVLLAIGEGALKREAEADSARKAVEIWQAIQRKYEKKGMVLKIDDGAALQREVDDIYAALQATPSMNTTTTAAAEEEEEEEEEEAEAATTDPINNKRKTTIMDLIDEKDEEEDPDNNIVFYIAEMECDDEEVDKMKRRLQSRFGQLRDNGLTLLPAAEEAIGKRKPRKKKKSTATETATATTST